MSEQLAQPRSLSQRLARSAAVFGPGLVVMLADTDVGSVITAGQSGVQFGYRLLGQQLILIPILYMVQELTVRLGIFTGRGHGELIAETFGRFWAWVSAIGLAVATAGALLTEFSGVAGVGELYGVPRAATVTLAAVALLAVVLTGSYRRVERVAIAVGLFRVRVLLRRLGGPPRAGRHGARRRQHPVAQPGLPVPVGGQHRRGDHALDGVLPAIRGRR